jgi:hypothetical protein
MAAQAERPTPRKRRACPPSRATFYRVLHLVDVAALERQLAVYAATLRTPTALPAVAVDGKWVRGAGTHGNLL